MDFSLANTSGNANTAMATTHSNTNALVQCIFGITSVILTISSTIPNVVKRFMLRQILMKWQLAPIFNKLAPLHVDTFHKYLVDWLLTDRIAFRQVESPIWRKFIATLRPEAISHVPKSGDTIRSWAMNRFDIACTEIK